MKNISAKAMYDLAWALSQASNVLRTFDPEGEAYANYQSKLQGAKSALAEVKAVRTAIAKGDRS